MQFQKLYLSGAVKGGGEEELNRGAPSGIGWNILIISFVQCVGLRKLMILVLVFKKPNILSPIWVIQNFKRLDKRRQISHHFQVSKWTLMSKNNRLPKLENYHYLTGSYFRHGFHTDLPTKQVVFTYQEPFNHVSYCTVLFSGSTTPRE